MEPLARHVEFLADVLHETKRFVHRARPVVLPAALIFERTIGLLANNPPVHVAPERLVHRVDIAARRVLPACDTLRRDGIRRRAVELRGLRVVVRIPRHVLALSVDKQLIHRQTARSFRLKYSITEGLPFQLEQRPAAEHRLLTRRSGIEHRGFRRARIRRREPDGLRQVVDSAVQQHRHRPAPGQCAGGKLRPGDGRQRVGCGAGIGVISCCRDMDDAVSLRWLGSLQGMFHGISFV